jgi:hypothetical protein
MQYRRQRENSNGGNIVQFVEFSLTAFSLPSAYPLGMSNFSIVGFWKFKSNRIRQEDGTWQAEKIFGGTMAFSEQGEAVLFFKSDQGVWGYNGRYEIKGDQITVNVEAGMVEEIDGSSITRNFKFLNANELIYTGIETGTGRIFETFFYRV